MVKSKEKANDKGELQIDDGFGSSADSADGYFPLFRFLAHPSHKARRDAPPGV
jgi:hypothetical protein